MMSIHIQAIFFLAILHLSTQFAPRDIRDQSERDIRSIRNSNVDQIDNKKRPFCNAFTGCGKKRSEPKSIQDDTLAEAADESINSLLDLNSEPAVEDLMRQIMSEAKIWEAIQEANLELGNQKVGRQRHLNLAFNAQ